MLPPVYALLFAAAAAGCSIYASLELHIEPSPLRLVERVLSFALVAVLSLGVRTRAVRESGSASLLAFPLAITAAAAAGWEVYLESTGKETFPKGLYDLGTLPQQNATLFGIVLLFVFLGVISDLWHRVYTAAAALAALLFGAAMVYGLAVTLGISISV